MVRNEVNGLLTGENHGSFAGEVMCILNDSNLYAKVALSGSAPKAGAVLKIAGTRYEICCSGLLTAGEGRHDAR